MNKKIFKAVTNLAKVLIEEKEFMKLRRFVGAYAVKWANTDQKEALHLMVRKSSESTAPTPKSKKKWKRRDTAALFGFKKRQTPKTELDRGPQMKDGTAVQDQGLSSENATGSPEATKDKDEPWRTVASHKALSLAGEHPYVDFSQLNEYKKVNVTSVQRVIDEATHITINITDEEE